MEAVEAGTAGKPAAGAVLAHDLRSAISTITAAMNILARRTEDETEKRTIEAARQAAGTALMLARELAENTAGPDAIAIAPVETPLAPLLAAIENALTVRAADKGLAATIERRKGLPDAVRIDPLRLTQIVDNLVVNALAATAAGAVRLTVSAARQGKETALLRFVVEDTGPGLPPDGEALARLFEPNVRGEAGAPDGSGLGLWIASTLADRMGGAVRAEPAETGARFVAELAAPIVGPVPAEAEAETGGPAGPAPAALTVLVADDTPINRTLLTTLLTSFDMECEAAASGAEAIAALMRRPFDAVLLDVQMPEMDGFETLERLRALGAAGSVPVIAVTARALAGEADRLIAAGFDGYVSKPVDARQLYLTLLATAQKQAAEGAG